MRKLVVLIAIVALFAVPAYAEVQNVKVSGDITLRGLHRAGTNLGAPLGASTVNGGADMFFMSTVRVKVDADLTDNVSTCVRLVNEKDWGSNSASIPGVLTNSGVASPYNVGVDLAYVTMKEFLYQPLTLTLGRQPVVFGKGFIVGNNVYAWDPNNSIGANEYSTFTAFDGIRATLDYNPWTIDAIYLVISEPNSLLKLVGPSMDDTKTKTGIDMMGVNVGYKFSEYSGEAEAYYFFSRDHQSAQWPFVDPALKSELNVVGLRGSFEPIANLSLWGEGAYQFGHTLNADRFTAPTDRRDVSAWACDFGLQYIFSDYAWKPKLGGEIIAYSGEKNPTSATGKYKGWIPTPTGKFDTAIFEFLNLPTGLGYNTGDLYAPSGLTNNIQYSVFGAIQPTESIGVSARYTHLRLVRSLANDYTVDSTGAAHTRSKHLGDEVDVMMTYDYTEDVQFGLLGAVFFPGDYYDDSTGVDPDVKSTATDHRLVGSVKVSF